MHFPSPSEGLTIVVILVICGLINGAIAIAPVNSDVRRWGFVAVLLGTACFFAARFLL